MNRPIKFRAWDTVLEKMLDMKEIERSGMNLFSLCEGVKIVKLMQYTGLTDRNGKEIYEGDILDTGAMVWLVEPISTEERDGDRFGICASPNGNGEAHWMDKSIYGGKIIGNIYEHPELLEG